MKQHKISKRLIWTAIAAVLVACGVYTRPEATPARSDVSHVTSKRPVSSVAIWTSRERVPTAYRHTVDWHGWTGEPILAVFSEDYVCTFVFDLGAPDVHRGDLLDCHWYAPRGISSYNSPAADPRHILRFNAALLRQWSLLFREFHTEFLQCVYAYAVPGDVDTEGNMLNDTVKVAFAINANLPPSSFYPDSVAPPADWNEDICPPTVGNFFILLADVHNHIPRFVNGVRTTYCYPSDKDYASSFERQGVPIAFILCDENRLVYFSSEGLIASCTWNPEIPFNMQLVCKREGPPGNQ